MHLSLRGDTVAVNESSDFCAPQKLEEHQHFSTGMKTRSRTDKMLHTDCPTEATIGRDGRNQNDRVHLSTHLNEIPTCLSRAITA